jgi:hypothetical protein
VDDGRDVLDGIVVSTGGNDVRNRNKLKIVGLREGRGFGLRADRSANVVSLPWVRKDV